MVIPHEFGLQRIQTFALEHLAAFSGGSGDMHWAIAALALSACKSIWVRGQRKYAQEVRNAARRLGWKASLTPGLAAADTMVAAGGR